jgi:hypothetical protein
MKKIYKNRFLLVFVVLMWGTMFQSLTAQWSSDPLVNNAISTVTGSGGQGQSASVIVSDGSGGAIIAWEDHRTSDFDIYAQRIDVSGALVGSEIAVSTATGEQRSPSIVSDGAGGAIITWKDSRSGFNMFDIYGQRIDSSGTAVWTENGAAICTADEMQERQTIASDGSGGAIITWEDQRSGSGAGYKIYAQRIDANGSIHSGWTADGVAIRSNLSGSVSLPTILGDGSGGAIITWADYRSLSNYDIYAQKIDAAGDTLWTANGAPVCTFGTNQGRPLIVSDGAAGAIIEWTDNDINSGDLFAQRINSSGTKLWAANGVVVCGATNIQQYSTMISDGSGGVIVTWRDTRNGLGDIYAQRVNGNGDTIWTADGEVICAAADDQYWPTAVADGASGAVITWHDNRTGTSNYDIYAQRINASGIVQWTTDGEAVSINASWQGYPVIATDGSGGAIITWYDYRNGTPNIYASQVSANGNLGTGPLPVELTSFTASSKEKTVELKWNTATETDNYGFEVERTVISHQSSVISWNKAGFVEGNGTTNAPNEYSFNDRNVGAGKYLYRLKQIDRGGKFTYTQEVEVMVGKMPEELSLLQNYPNPFNPTTKIEFTVPVTGRATLKVFNAIGQEVATLFDGAAETGQYHRVTFNAKDLSSGIYFARLVSDGTSQMKKLLFVK